MKTKDYLLQWVLALFLVLFISACSDDDEPKTEPRVLPYMQLESGDLLYHFDSNRHEISMIWKTNQERIYVEMFDSIGNDEYSPSVTWIKEATTRAEITSLDLKLQVEANEKENNRIAYMYFWAGKPYEEGSVCTSFYVKVIQDGRESH